MEHESHESHECFLFIPKHRKTRKTLKLLLMINLGQDCFVREQSFFLLDELLKASFDFLEPLRDSA